MVRKADATWVPRSLAPPRWRRSTRGRILPSLSTGLDHPCFDAPDGSAGHELGRKWAYLNRRDHHLAAASNLPEQRTSPLEVELGQDAVHRHRGAVPRP